MISFRSFLFNCSIFYGYFAVTIAGGFTNFVIAKTNISLLQIHCTSVLEYWIFHTVSVILSFILIFCAKL